MKDVIWPDSRGTFLRSKDAADDLIQEHASSSMNVKIQEMVMMMMMITFDIFI